MAVFGKKNDDIDKTMTDIASATYKNQLAENELKSGGNEVSSEELYKMFRQYYKEVKNIFEIKAEILAKSNVAVGEMNMDGRDRFINEVMLSPNMSILNQIKFEPMFVTVKGKQCLDMKESKMFIRDALTDRDVQIYPLEINLDKVFDESSAVKLQNQFATSVDDKGKSKLGKAEVEGDSFNIYTLTDMGANLLDTYYKDSLMCSVYRNLSQISNKYGKLFAELGQKDGRDKMLANFENAVNSYKREIEKEAMINSIKVATLDVKDNISEAFVTVKDVANALIEESKKAVSTGKDTIKESTANLLADISKTLGDTKIKIGQYATKVSEGFALMAAVDVNERNKSAIINSIDKWEREISKLEKEYTDMGLISGYNDPIKEYISNAKNKLSEARHAAEMNGWTSNTVNTITAAFRDARENIGKAVSLAFDKLKDKLNEIRKEKIDPAKEKVSNYLEEKNPYLLNDAKELIKGAKMQRDAIADLITHGFAVSAVKIEREGTVLLTNNENAVKCLTVLNDLKGLSIELDKLGEKVNTLEKEDKKLAKTLANKNAPSMSME